MTPEEREKDHIESYWETPCKPYHEYEETIDLFGHKYKLVLCAFGDRYEEHRVMFGQVDMTSWLSEKEQMEVIRYLSEYWPEVEMP